MPMRVITGFAIASAASQARRNSSNTLSEESFKTVAITLTFNHAKITRGSAHIPSLDILSRAEIELPAREIDHTRPHHRYRAAVAVRAQASAGGLVIGGEEEARSPMQVSVITTSP